MSSRSIFEFLANASVPVVVRLVFSLARRYTSSATLKPPETAYPREDLDFRFSNVQWLVGAGMVVIGVLFAYGS